MESDPSRTSSNSYQTRKVLIAIDNNPEARKVLKSGYSYSKKTGAEIVLINVVSRPSRFDLPEYSPVIKLLSYDYPSHDRLISNNILKKETKSYLENLKHSIGDTNIRTIVAEGDPAEEIVYAADNLKADLIVMGHHRKKWLGRIIFGDVVKKVLNRAKVPVLLVPDSIISSRTNI